MTLRAESIQAMYRVRFGLNCTAGRQRMWKSIYENWMSEFIPESARYLELGVGRCELLNAVRATEKAGVDLNPDVRTYADPGTQLVIGDMLSAFKSLPTHYTHIVASNVFEHLPSVPYFIEVLHQCHRHLASGGRLIVMGPNINYVRERYWDFADHILPFNHIGMTEALVSAGFEVEYMKKRFLPYCTKCSYPQWYWIVKLYLKLPPLHWAFGKQFFIVARKP